MARRPCQLPTTIYWLVDVRPETIANGWPSGYPFYCGKTIFTPHKRLVEHRYVATKKPHLAIAAWIRGCGEHIRFQIMETVPADGDWAARERYWIATMRLLWPLCANTTAGGQGVPGLVHSRESVERRVAKVRGRKHTKEAKAKIGAAGKGRKRSAESIELTASKTRGQKRTPEQKARAAAGQLKHRIKKAKKRAKRLERRKLCFERRRERQKLRQENQQVIEPLNAEISIIC